MKAGAGVKLNYDFSDLKYKHRPVVPLCALKAAYTAGLIAGVTLMLQCLRHHTSILLRGRLSCQALHIVAWSRSECGAVGQMWSEKENLFISWAVECDITTHWHIMLPQTKCKMINCQKTTGHLPSVCGLMSLLVLSMAQNKIWSGSGPRLLSEPRTRIDLSSCFIRFWQRLYLDCNLTMFTQLMSYKLIQPVSDWPVLIDFVVAGWLGFLHKDSDLSWWGQELANHRQAFTESGCRKLTAAVTEKHMKERDNVNHCDMMRGRRWMSDTEIQTFIPE